jgi:Fe-S cluster assembly ATP-binding protein
MALLEIKGLTYKAGDKKILADFSMSIESSEVHALLGANGTGKSTLAYLIMGCEGYNPTSGKILFEGKVINDLKIHEKAHLGITMAWQEPVRFEGIAVRDYLTLNNKDIDPAHYIGMVGLHPELYLHRMVDKSLSGGERKRLELASILALHPKLAILDEPDSGIDMFHLDIVTLSTHHETCSSVLLITHREEIVIIADKASQLCNVKVVCSGSPAKVAEYYNSRKCLACNGEVCAYV